MHSPFFAWHAHKIEVKCNITHFLQLCNIEQLLARIDNFLFSLLANSHANSTMSLTQFSHHDNITHIS